MEEYHKFKSKYSGTLYSLRWTNRGSGPVASGNEGRWNGYGTNAFYFADSVETCELELKSRWGIQYSREKYDLVKYYFEDETVLDFGQMPGTSLLESKEENGYRKTHELASWARDHRYGVLQCASSPAHMSNSPGTCIIIFPDLFKLDESKIVVEHC